MESTEIRKKFTNAKIGKKIGRNWMYLDVKYSEKILTKSEV